MPADNKSELFQLVSRGGKLLGVASREACHGNPTLIHLVIHCHVFDPGGRLLLQKRSLSKDTNPGLWDTSVGGHVSAGEPVRAALLRECREELGIDGAAAVRRYSYLLEGSFESEFAECFTLETREVPTPDPLEIDEVRWYSQLEVQAMMGTGALTPMFEHEWPLLLDALNG
jgi:isopentenyl-diphosphate delta-isomerase type 1